MTAMLRLLLASVLAAVVLMVWGSIYWMGISTRLNVPRSLGKRSMVALYL